MQLQAGEKVGRYEIRRLIGKGAFSKVYAATDPELNREVALKVSRQEYRDPSDSPLLNEARILAQLQHPSILSIFDVVRSPDRIVVVLEFMEGGTLRDSFRDEEAELSQERIVGLIASVADALDYVHRRGFLHRDVKPSIILQDGGGEPRLSGFEVAVPKTDLASASIAGTLPYMAPEQFAHAIDLIAPPTDIWGLGVSLYQGLTRQLPFHSHSPYELQRLVEREDPTPPSLRQKSISTDLDRVCLRCLAKNPADRYRDAAALAADLRQALKPRKQQRVFVSHSTQDREFVEREIINQLEANGIKTWYSKVDIQSSAEWERSILRGLDSCDWFLIVMSTRSAASEWVKDELHWAIDKRPNRIIPVLIEDCNLRDFHIRMARIQYVDFRNPSRESRAQLLELLTAESA